MDKMAITKETDRLPLPIGVSDYRAASTEYYYVDKTLLIRDLLDERAKVSLFTRPRRFGKTLNMDMLRVFFEKTQEDTSVYFQNRKIWSCGKKYRDYQGKYPVIFISLKDVKCETWAETYDLIFKLLQNEFKRHPELMESTRISVYEKKYLTDFLAGDVNENDVMMALQSLSQMLDEHYEMPPMIIIDEYDTPIQQGHIRGFYDRVTGFMRNLFSGGLKDNPHLAFGFLTGILRVARESIFSGLNNLKINSLLDNRYSEYFGFTPDEVREMAAYYQAGDKYDEICDWYDGYQFGRFEIFNPWSVICYFGNECQPKAFWQSTGSNDIIHEMLMLSDEEITETLRRLLLGDTIQTKIDSNVIYPQIHNNPAAIYSFLLMAGYLKPVGERMLIGSSDFYTVTIPNKEIAGVYRSEILEKLEAMIPQPTASALQLAIYSNNAPALQQNLRKLLLQSASCFDTVGENFYNGLLLGLCAAMEQYVVTSNHESGEGRYDICLWPKADTLPGILIELKADRKCSTAKLKELAQTALRQIEDRQYDTELRSHGIQTIFKYGVAFSGKAVEVASASTS
ncbi:MAG: AAA family ATPase [Lachnospiraceae bacterium]|nr:AAA family ATPase [Lachnospiraceae bacterium]